MNDTLSILEKLNTEYLTVHKEYERFYWISYMGDKSVDSDFQKAKAHWNGFRESRENAQIIDICLKNEMDEKLKERLHHWKNFFDLYQTPDNISLLRDKITTLENEIRVKRAEMKTGYIDPKTEKWYEAPETKLSFMVITEPDEMLRKACFIGKESAAKVTIHEYVELVKLRNEYARSLGFRDFYHYKAHIEEQMDSNEIFRIFDDLSETLIPFCLEHIKKMEKTSPDLRTPWNLRYKISGDFIREEDQYFPIETILDVWGRSFAALGIDYKDSTLNLDLLERERKYNNGFCHMPTPVHYQGETRVSAEVNFSCNAIIGQIGSGINTGNTLFHEGGHAAHYANMNQKEIFLNTEYPPMSTAWAETQSMFLDTLFSSAEWKMRYAKNLTGESYPLSLYEEKFRKTFLLEPLSMLRIVSVIEFERRIYSAEHLDAAIVQKIAEETSIKYNGFSEPSLYLLSVPHIYSWSASCAYHGYALATLALTQWQEYLYDKYGYIVDNPVVGQVMAKMWNYGSSKGFSELVKIATEQKLSPQAYLNQAILGEEQKLAIIKERLKIMEGVPEFSGEVNLNAKICIVDGTKTISSNKAGFPVMCEEFRKYVEEKKKTLI